MDDVASGQPPGDGGDGDADATEIRTFLIADVRGWTSFTQQRGDEAAATARRQVRDGGAHRRRGPRRVGDRAPRRRGARGLRFPAAGDPRRGRPATSARRRDRCRSVAAAARRRRARRRRGGPGRGRLPGRRVEPGRAAVQPGGPGPDPREPRGHAPRPDDRGRRVRGRRRAVAEGTGRARSRDPRRPGGGGPGGAVRGAAVEDRSRVGSPRHRVDGASRAGGRSSAASSLWSRWRRSASRRSCAGSTTACRGSTRTPRGSSTRRTVTSPARWPSATSRAGSPPGPVRSGSHFLRATKWRASIRRPMPSWIGSRSGATRRPSSSETARSG